MTDDVITDELREKAKVIAEATGRSEEKIIEDLLDDGVGFFGRTTKRSRRVNCYCAKH